MTSESIHQETRHLENAKLSDTARYGAVCLWAGHRTRTSLLLCSCCMVHSVVCPAINFILFGNVCMQDQDITGYWFSNNGTQLPLLIILVLSRLSAHSDLALYVGFFLVLAEGNSWMVLSMWNHTLHEKKQNI